MSSRCESPVAATPEKSNLSPNKGPEKGLVLTGWKGRKGFEGPLVGVVGVVGVVGLLTGELGVTGRNGLKPLIGLKGVNPPPGLLTGVGGCAVVKSKSVLLEIPAKALPAES